MLSIHFLSQLPGYFVGISIETHDILVTQAGGTLYTASTPPMHATARTPPEHATLRAPHLSTPLRAPYLSTPHCVHPTYARHAAYPPTYARHTACAPLMHATLRAPHLCIYTACPPPMHATLRAPHLCTPHWVRPILCTVTGVCLGCWRIACKNASDKCVTDRIAASNVSDGCWQLLCHCL